MERYRLGGRAFTNVPRGAESIGSLPRAKLARTSGGGSRRRWLNWPCCQNPAESPQPPNALRRARRRSPGEQDSTQGQLSLFERAPSGADGRGRHEQEFRQAKKAAEAKVAEDAQGTSQQKRAAKKFGSGPVLPADKSEPRRSTALPGSMLRAGAGMRVTRLGGVQASKDPDVLRKPLTLAVQLPELAQLDVAQRGPRTEEERHTLVSFVSSLCQAGSRQL